MQRNLAALTEGTFDLLIIGGGIFGAGVARDAALRGWRVALIDQNDFASGTSSRSSKLIHGGFRYLEQYDFALVAESSRERRILREIAPHRVKPLPLLLPVYKNDSRPLWLLRAGMTLYDLLAMYRNVAAHRTLSPAAAHDLEPGLRSHDLRGAIRFYDCQEDDARFCIDNILHAANLGATCANYCQAISFHVEAERVSATRVCDMLGGNVLEIRARVIINTAGPWVERVAALAPESQNSIPRLSPTKGVHILLPRLTQSHGIFFQGKNDARMMFVLPWNNCTMIGTTDTDFHGDPASVYANASEVKYLLAEAQMLFPENKLAAADVITTFAGIRPLLRSSANTPSSRSRAHQVLRTGKNMLSIAGGKYTTYRLVAKQAVDEAYEILGQRSAPCETATTPLPDNRPTPRGAQIADTPEIYESDIEHAVRDEMATSVTDVMRRRTGLELSRFGGIDIAKIVGRIMARIDLWDEDKLHRSMIAYQEELERNRAWKSC